MATKILKQLCQCQCGITKFTIIGEPIVRIACHCKICQEFNKAPFADITIFLSKDVILEDIQTVSLRKYKSPPAVQRGKCIECDKPVIEFLDLPLFPSLTIIPSEHIPYGPLLPKLSAHIFYHRRVADIDDALPKISGSIKSQLALSKKLLPGIFLKFVNP
tara:strand:- start:10911 stop:11393 length:483 start_codon:yes stop_codon:yes gene_type:complete